MTQPIFMERRVALCVDAEGTREQIERLLDVFERASARVTFFFVGETAQRYPDLVRRAAARHQIESHTLTHPNLLRLSPTEQEQEVLGGREAVQEITGAPSLGFRAPYHCYNRVTVEILNERGFSFDASSLYWRLPMGRVTAISPHWFREWAPFYPYLGISFRRALGVFTRLARLRRHSVLPLHPHYSGASDDRARELARLLTQWHAHGIETWTIHEYIAANFGNSSISQSAARA